MRVLGVLIGGIFFVAVGLAAAMVGLIFLVVLALVYIYMYVRNRRRLNYAGQHTRG